MIGLGLGRRGTEQRLLVKLGRVTCKRLASTVTQEGE